MLTMTIIDRERRETSPDDMTRYEKRHVLGHEGIIIFSGVQLPLYDGLASSVDELRAMNG